MRVGECKYCGQDDTGKCCEASTDIAALRGEVERLERVRVAAKRVVSARDDYFNNIAKYAGRGGFVREADEALREALREVGEGE